MPKGNSHTDIICQLAKITKAITTRCTIASFNHFVLLSGEGRLAKTLFRIPEPSYWSSDRHSLWSGVGCRDHPSKRWIGPNKPRIYRNSNFCYAVFFLPIVVYFNVSLYKEVRRNKKQIIANQVSLDEKEKLLKNKKAF